MFKELGQIASLIKQAPKIKEEMEKLQQRLGQLVADGDAGAGMVKVKANGRMEIIECRVTEDALKMNDREVLEEMIKGAVNQALQRARQLVGEESGKVAAGFGLPGLPDFSSMLGK